MSGSLAFQKIRHDVLQATLVVPAGKLTTYADLGDHLEVMARHVSYILATLTEAEKPVIPWHRVVSKDGKISSTHTARREEQILLLRSEGHQIERNRVLHFEEKRHHYPVRSMFRESRGAYSDPNTPTLYPPAPSTTGPA